MNRSLIRECVDRADPCGSRAVKHWPVLLLTLVLLLAAGCQTYTKQAESMTAAWSAGAVDEAAKQFGQRASKKDDSRDAVIWHLEAGAAYRAGTNYAESNRHLDAAAARVDDYERKAKVRLGNEAAAIMSNQQNLPYEGRSYDKIMLHTYKALNYLSLGEPDKARPELIRAYQRQQDAVAENKRRIEEALKAEKNSPQSEAVARSKANPGLKTSVSSLTNNLGGFKFYADYVNPFTVYLDGLYFLHAGAGASDLERANKSLQRVAEIYPDNPSLQADRQLAEAVVNGAPNNQPLTYVIFETGRAASREQVRIDIPIIVVDVSYVGAAFPQLQFHADQAPVLTVEGAGASQTSALVADMDAVIALDFKNEWPAILTKTLISTTAKAAAGWAANRAAGQQSDGLGLFIRIVTAAAQAAMNIADTRSWTTLPKQFQVVRLNTPPDRRVSLSTPGRPPMTVALIDGVVNVVYVRSISAAAPLLVSQFTLK